MLPGVSKTTDCFLNLKTLIMITEPFGDVHMEIIIEWLNEVIDLYRQRIIDMDFEYILDIVSKHTRDYITHHNIKWMDYQLIASVVSDICLKFYGEYTDVNIAWAELSDGAFNQRTFNLFEYYVFEYINYTI